MNKVELAVCRIRQILPKDEGSLTRGSGCAVKCERLSSALGWKCSFLLVTSSSVLHCDELAAGKTFVADFLLKDKKGLESFELNLASDTCVDILGRNTADITEFTAESSTKEQSMTIISVEKLDKRGFLKRMTKKSSLQTTRPLECFDTAKLSEELSDGLFCHITREGGQDFSTRTYKFLFETESHRFVLHDFGNAEITSVRGFPNDEMPLGAVIYTKRGEFAGLLEFSDEAIEPCFFPVEFRLSSTAANGQPVNEGLSNNNASTAPVSEEQADTRSKDDEERAGLHDAKNDDEGKVMMHTEDEGQMAQGAGDSSATEHEVPVASSSPVSVEVALNTSHQTEESAVEELHKGDAIPSCESAVVSDDQDEVLVEEQAVSEASPCQISEQESCNVDVNNATQEDAEIGNTGPEETAMPGDEEGENEHKTPADLLGTTSELLTSNISVDDSTNTEGEILLNTMEKTEAGLVDPNKPVEPSDAAGEVVESAGDEEHSSFVVEMTAVGSVERSQAAEDGPEESAQTSAVAEVFESAAHSGLGDEKLADLRAEQDEGIPEPVDTSEESQPNNEAESSTPTEEKALAVVVCSPEALTDQDPVADITSTASTDADLNNEKEDLGDGEPRESCKLEEQQINVVEMAEDGEGITEDARLERDQGEPGHLENEKDENKQEGSGEGMEDERLKLSEVGVSEIGERSEHEVEESLNKEEDREVGEDKETGKTAMTDKKGEDEEEVKTGDQEDDEAEKSGDEPQTVELDGEPDKDEEGETEELRTHDEETKYGEGEDDAKVSIEEKENEEVKEADGSENREPGQRAEEVPLTKEVEKSEEQEEKEGNDLNDIVPQKFDGDSLLSETITNNSRLLDELAKCLDTDYQYSLLPNWRDMADLLAIPPEAYEHYDVYSVSSPTEDLFVFLSSTRPDLSMKEIREALAEIGRQDVVKIIDKFRTRQLISDESVVGSLVEREDRDLLGKLALVLDRGSAVTWRHLAEQLAIPRRVYRNFGSGQGSNSALLLLKYLPIFDPDLTISDLKELLEKIFRHEAAAVLSSAGIPDDEHVRYILDDTELMEQISDLLNEDPPSPNWRQLAKELRVPQEKCRLFENTDEKRSCTKLLLRSLEKSEPDLTVEELILALVAMKRQDVLDVLANYLDGDDIDSIMEENNLLLDESLDSLSGGDTAN